MNRVFLAGVISKPPLMNETQNQVAALSFDLCVKESWMEKSGKECEKITFVKCVQYGKAAAMNHAKIEEGDSVIIEGSLVVVPDTTTLKNYRHEVKIQTLELV